VDPEEQNNLAASNAPRRENLIKQLDRSLKEMKAEMPVRNPAFNPDSESRRMNLKFTKDLAEKERGMFESRLKQ
jgi:hypothetical protein